MLWIPISPNKIMELISIEPIQFTVKGQYFSEHTRNHWNNPWISISIRLVVPNQLSTTSFFTCIWLHHLYPNFHIPEKNNNRPRSKWYLISSGRASPLPTPSYRNPTTTLVIRCPTSILFSVEVHSPGLYFCCPKPSLVQETVISMKPPQCNWIVGTTLLCCGD